MGGVVIIVTRSGNRSRATTRFDAACRELCAEVQREVDELAQVIPVMFDGNDLPDDHTPIRRTRLFPLGEYRSVALGALAGSSKLYLGRNGRLYEYGPAALSTDSLRYPTRRNAIRVRPVKLGELKIHELQAVRNLVRRIWL